MEPPLIWLELFEKFGTLSAVVVAHGCMRLECRRGSTFVDCGESQSLYGSQRASTSSGENLNSRRSSLVVLQLTTSVL